MRKVKKRCDTGRKHPKTGKAIFEMMDSRDGDEELEPEMIPVEFSKKHTDVHKAAVVGDTVGDPLKDTSGPSLNILVKLSAIISLIFAKVF